MIGAIGPADIPSLVLAITGVVPLAVLVRRYRAGAWRAAEPPFRAGSPEIPLLVAGTLFVAYSFGLLAASGRFGPIVALGAIVALLAAAAAGALLARRAVLLPRGPLAWRIGTGLLVLWAAFPVVLSAFLLCRLFGPEQSQVDVLRSRAEGWPWLAASAVVVAPVVEEVCFRGLLY
ncbi:MAG: hypothetical protein L6Q95_15945, partial [Planctomycetes bacterium]|nr:hypothetical protein [Planctomycetota bacterium]